MRLDTHVHTIKSYCSLNSLKIINKLATNPNLLMAITDHNRFTKVKNTIPGIEIKTNQGEIIGLFINNEIKPWQDALDVIDQIHSQGGFAVLAHPFDKIRKDAAKNPNKELIKSVDFLELNGRSLKPFIEKTINAIKRFNKPFLVGSDAHLPWELNRTYLRVKATKEELMEPKMFFKIVKKSSLDDIVMNNSTLFQLSSMIVSGISSKTRRLKAKLFNK